jgi:hypothetical protein
MDGRGLQGDIMTKRECPWCGGSNLRVENCMATTGLIHWKDNECGYREKTYHQIDGRSGEYPFHSCIEPRQKKTDYEPRKPAEHP